MTRARDVSRLITTPTSAYTAYDEVVVSSASPSSSTPIWINTLSASAPTINTYSNNKWLGTRLIDLGVLTLDYLVVAGGGGGGNGLGSGTYASGGGGAGGLRCTVNATGGGGSPETPLGLSLNTAYTVTVGAGGTFGALGSNSIFHTITSVGGGSGTPFSVSRNGGSGGGGGDTVGTGGDTTPGTGTVNQGFGGGTPTGGQGFAGAGGGAGAAGSNRIGGNGVATTISGSSVTYAGGGSGGGNTTISGGSGGGGSGGTNGNSTDGLGNTGGGGGGTQSTDSTTQRGKTGGSGVIIIKFPDIYTATVSVGLTSTNTSSNGYKIYSFTAGTGTVTFS